MGSQLQGTRRLIGRGLVYLANIAVLAAAFFGLLLLFHLIFASLQPALLAAALALIALSAVLLVPLHQLNQRIFTPTLGTKKPAVLRPLDEILIKVAEADSLDEFAGALNTVMQQDLKLSFAAFLTYAEISKLIRWDYFKYEGSKAYYQLFTSLKDQPVEFFNQPELVLTESGKYHSGILMKLKINEEWCGLIVLGPREDRNPFSPEDLLLLESLAKPMSVIVRNLFRVKELGEKINTADQTFEQLQHSRDELQLINQNLVRDSEEDRKNLATQLQNVTLQKLISIISQFENSTTNPTLREEIVWNLALDAQQSLLSLLRHLRPATLDQLGLVDALNGLKEDVKQKSKLSIKLKVGEETLTRRLPAEVELTLYRAAQEALENVLTHSKAQHVTVSLSIVEETETVRLVVLDDGVGFEPPSEFQPGQGHRHDHLGLAGLQERLTVLGGHLNVRSSPGAGTIVEAEIPLKIVEAEVLSHREILEAPKALALKMNEARKFGYEGAGAR